MTGVTNIQLERKIATNEWVIKARWFYMVGIFIIGILSKVISKSNVNFSFASMSSLLLSFIIFNYIFYFLMGRVDRTKPTALLNITSLALITIELIYFVIIMHMAGGIESIATVFFFLPVISTSLMFGARGSIITAVICGFLINILVILEYFGYITHISRYGIDTIEFKDLSYGLTKTITISIFYIIAGFFAGYGANMLFQREKSFEEEAVKLDNQTYKLIKHDKKLSKINQELTVERNKVSSLLANFVDPIIVLDKDNKISLTNPAAEKMLGITKNDLGQEISSKNNFSIENFKNIIKRAYTVKKVEQTESEKIMTEETDFKISSQEITYKIITAPVMASNKEFLGTMKIFYDLTRENMIDRLKTEFISIAAHQLRTPLSAIKWVIKMVLDGDAGKLNKEQRDLLSKGYKSNERVINLVNDLLNVSRIEEGRFGYSFANCNFQDILNVVIENTERVVAKNHLKLTLNKPEKMPIVFLDKDRITLALQNLLDNAVKYTPEYGKIELNVENLGKELKIMVKDNGIGIPERNQAKLFSKFFRAANVIRSETEGTGLGLFITKNIIERHGGRINIASQEGKGTTVSVTIPIHAKV